MTLHPRPSPPAPDDVTGASPVDHVLRDLHARIAAEPPSGRVADYIPELAGADPGAFGIALATVQGDVHEVGHTEVEFTIQSISKVILYGMALEDRGEAVVAGLVGVEPTGEAFNSIRLHPDRSTPLNPMVNAGAITTTGLVRGGGGDERMDRILTAFERYTGRPARIDPRVYRSERETGHRNRAIAHLLRNFSVVTEDPDRLLDDYFRQCSILVTCRDLAVMGATLANRGVNPITGERAVGEAHVPSVLSVMATCGMYDFAGQWLHDIGLPAKSGVAGGILAVLPGQIGFGTLSPPLDGYGTSVRGIRACRLLAEELDLHLLDPPRPGAAVHRGGAPARAGSRRMRSGAATAALDAAGDRILAYRPHGDMTFATAVAASRKLIEHAQPNGFAVLDLSGISRLDGAAAAILAALGDTLAPQRTRVLVSGAGHTRLGDEIERRSALGNGSSVALWGAAEDALEWCEDQILAELGAADADGPVPLEAGELCRRMTPAEVADLRAAVDRVEFASGQVMIEEGTPSDHLLVVEGGRASVVTTGSGGTRMRIAGLAPGMFVGEVGLIDGGVRSASVVADTPVTAYRLTRAALEGLADDPDLRTRTVLLLNIAETLSSHVRRAVALLAAGRD